jgi:hypothetical protein
MEDYMTKEEREIENQACIEAMREWDRNEAAKQAKLLKRIKKRVSASWYKSIMEYLEDCEFTHDFSITDTPVGERQRETYRFGYCYVNQYSNGGISGDDFAGQVCLPIRGGLYFSYHYSC